MNVSKIIFEGLIFSAVASAYLLAVLWWNPRLFLQDYPAAIQQKVPPKTAREKWLSLVVGIPFLLLLFGYPLWSTLSLAQKLRETAGFWTLFFNAFGIGFAFNLVDLLLLDWLLSSLLTPDFVILPGTKGHPAYKDYAFHARGFLVGTVLAAGFGLLIAALTRAV